MQAISVHDDFRHANSLQWEAAGRNPLDPGEDGRLRAIPSLASHKRRWVSSSDTQETGLTVHGIRWRLHVQ